MMPLINYIFIAAFIILIWVNTNVIIVKNIKLGVHMKKVLFICHGNICRSTMAEFVMKDIVKKRGLENDFYIESAATHTDALGSDTYPATKEKLRENDISFEKRAARQIRKADYENFDYLIGMDEANRRNIKKAMGGDPDGKISLLLDHTEHPREISDPWYTRDFDTTYNEITEGTNAFLDKIIKTL